MFVINHFESQVLSKFIVRKAITVEKIIKVLKKIFQENDYQGKVNVIFLTSDQIRLINKEYLGKDRETDVISFNFDDLDNQSDLTGEVYVAPEVCIRDVQTGENRIKEICRVIIHGILHLYGHDHKDYFYDSKTVMGQVNGLEESGKQEPMFIEQERLLKLVSEKLNLV